MQHTLKSFTSKSLPLAVSELLAKLKVNYCAITGDSIDLEKLFQGNKPAYLSKGLNRVKDAYLVGFINNATLDNEDNEEEGETSAQDDKAFIVFACDVNTEKDKTLSLSEFAHLTRALNRISQNHPVILITREGNLLSIATTERSSYTQEWRKGERVGKVCALRNINCDKPHPGHIDFLNNLGDKNYPTFDEFYKHWMEVFSCELLTEKFYKELYTWYSWAVQEVKFPNDLRTNEDDADFNHESCIRLITRLIFVWFLKQKHLIPEEFFDEKYIRENLIENFNPEGKYAIPYNPDDSKYYRLILQNLFFATLNCPIVAEGKTTANNRRFSNQTSNFMHYEAEFMPEGAQKFIKLANSCVPFLNGGLFDCLDKGHCFYDGFSELSTSLEQLHLPDYLFFNSGKGLVDLLKKYHFTIEENTPYNQEVSLDPELLGKVFENLLAAYTDAGQTARNETGSFYTPREIVQYMVNESLVAHLKRKCGKDLESQYRQLLDIATTEVDLTQEQRKDIMEAIYECQVLDPACGSGAFPMGMLHQMVHVLKQVDPSNKMWNDMMINLATENASKELKRAATATEAEKERIEEGKQARLKDIEDAFNQSINDPDYARKLYLIENCIYGVDIQPIATQISKLRFFISLVVDQTPNQDAKNNFGVRPLPNLESKFVSANTLIPMDRSQDLFSSSDDIRDYQTQLQELNHRHFRAKKTSEKRALQEQMHATRMRMAQAMQNLGFIGDKGYEQLLWDMFDQNASASFFDPEWMFGVKDGFDVVIGNPPYIKENTNREAFLGIKGVNQYYTGKTDIWYIFACMGIDMLVPNGVLCFIAQNNWTTSDGARLMRKKIVEAARILQMVDFNDYMIFEDSASIQTMVMLFAKDHKTDGYTIDLRKLGKQSDKTDVLDMLFKISSSKIRYSNPTFCRKQYEGKYILFESNDVLEKIGKSDNYLTDSEIAQGIIFPQDFLNKKGAQSLDNPRFKVGSGVFGLNKQELDTLDLGEELELIKPYFTSKEILKYKTNPVNTLWMIYTNSSYSSSNSLEQYPKIKQHLDQFQSIITSSNKPYGLHRARNNKFFNGEKIIAQRKCVEAPLFSYSDFPCYVTQTYNIIKTDRWNMKFLTGLLNSKLVAYWLKNKGKMQGEHYQIDKVPLLQIPIEGDLKYQTKISELINKILGDDDINYDSLVADIDHHVYHLYNLTYDEVLIIDPDTSITREDYDNFKIED